MRILLLFSMMLWLCKAHAQPGRDSLLRSWQSEQLPDTVRLESLDELVWSYLRVNPDSAERYAVEEYKFAAQRNEPKYMGYALNYLGAARSERGDHLKAIDYHVSALQLRQKMGDDRGVAVSFNNLGQVYFVMARYATAADCYFKALKIRERIGDTSGMATSLGNIGALYAVRGDVRRSLGYQRRALRLLEKLNQEDGIARQLANMSYQYKEDLRDTATALRFQQRSAALYHKIGNRYGYTLALHSLGNTYGDLGQFRKADSIQRASLRIRRAILDSDGMAYCYYALASTAYHRNDLAGAVDAAEKALAIAKAVGSLPLQQGTGDFLYKRYRDLGRYRDALRRLEEVRVVEDSLNAQKLGEKLVEEQLKYDFEQKEQRTRIAHGQEQARLRRQAAAEKRARQRVAVGLGVLLVALAAAGAVVSWSARQRAVIARQKTNLLKQQLLISQLNPHFIFNALNAIQQTIFSRAPVQAATYLADFASLMRIILDCSRKDQITVADERLFLVRYLDLQRLRFGDSFTYAIEIDGSLDPDETLIPPMLAQPFIENAIEHGIRSYERGGHVAVRLRRRDHLLWYEISDNGIGLEAARRRADRTHQSTAIAITEERLAAFRRTAGTDRSVTITDKTAAGTGETGVCVTFSFPYQQTL